MKKSLIYLVWSSVFATTAMAATSTQNSAAQTVTLPNSAFSLQRGETHSLSLNGWHHVNKIIIQADGTYRDGVFEVVVNGDTKGTVYVPGVDPSYIVTVEETAESLEFRQVSGNTINIRDVKVIETGTVVNLSLSTHGGLPIGAGNTSAGLANQAIALADQLEPLVSPYDFMTYLFPIKKTAARSYSVASARGQVSDKSRQALLALKAQIIFANPFWDQCFQGENTFELAVGFVTIAEQIDSLLN